MVLDNASVNVLEQPGVQQKLAQVETCVHDLLSGKKYVAPDSPARDVEVCAIHALPPKKGLSTDEGQARLLHDLASIELQAMELGLRTLMDFRDSAPRLFCEQLSEVILDEARHLRLCLQALENLGFCWGSWPVHLGLWQATTADDLLLDRILIVHRYLEGSGLDAGDKILRRLSGLRNPEPRRVVQVIAQEELGHVQFGSRWYKEICRAQGVDAQSDFGPRLSQLFHRIPRRLERIQRNIRRKAGFSEDELDELEAFQERWNQMDVDLIHRNNN